MLAVSVLIVTHGRSGELQRCLESVAVAAARVSGLSFDLVVIVNGECHATREVLDRVRDGGRSVTVIATPRTSPAAARNVGLLRVAGTFVCFLDDDVAVPENYFEQARRTLERFPSLEVLGGPDTTFPDAGARETAIGLALRSPLATGKTRARHGGARQGSGPFPASEDALILCNLWIRSGVFTEEGYRFDESFWRNEENVLLHQLVGRSAMHDPDLIVHHRRKRRLSDFVRANFKSGFFRARSFWAHPRSVRIDFFVPSLFLLLGAAVPFDGWVGGGASGLVALYGALNLAYSCHSCYGSHGRDRMCAVSPAAKTRLGLVPLVAVYQLVITLAYGLGFLCGGGAEFKVRGAIKARLLRT